MDRYIHSFGGSFAIAVLLTALVFAAKLVSPSIEEWSEETFGHAWLYMGLLAIAVFIGLGLAPLRLTTSSRALATLVGGTAVISSLIIAAAAVAMAVLE
jgi:hypothetical protein